MTMQPNLRKFALSAHITVSVGWIGAVVAQVVGIHAVGLGLLFAAFHLTSGGAGSH